MRKISHTAAKYQTYDVPYGTKHNRRLINGKITGQNKCVGYCMYDGHPGFLNNDLRAQHDCINKSCYHYLAKEKSAVYVSAFGEALLAALADAAK